MRNTMLAFGLLAVVAGPACSGSSLSPVAPSSAPGASGTMIRGTASVMTAGSQSSPFSAEAPADALTVCVVDTDICADVNESGEFELVGDFSGDVRLHFFGGGEQDVELTVHDVQPGESVTVSVELNGQTGTLHVVSRQGDAEDDDAEDDEDDGPKISLCHRTGNGSYHLITISVADEPDHRAHGDAMVGEPVPADPTKTFGPTCALEDTAGEGSEEEAEEDEASDKDQPKVTLCHRTGNGSYRLISVSISAEPAHRAHGDAKVGEPVPADPSKVFGANCALAGGA